MINWELYSKGIRRYTRILLDDGTNQNVSIDQTIERASLFPWRYKLFVYGHGKSLFFGFWFGYSLDKILQKADYELQRMINTPFTSSKAVDKLHNKVREVKNATE